MLVRSLEGMDALEELYCRMIVEGYRDGEIATEMGVSGNTVRRIAAGMRDTLFGRDASDAASRPV